MQLTLLWATGTVTGSKYLLQHNATRVLIDCGLSQGTGTLCRRQQTRSKRLYWLETGRFIS